MTPGDSSLSPVLRDVESVTCAIASEHKAESTQRRKARKVLSTHPAASGERPASARNSLKGVVRVATSFRKHPAARTVEKIQGQNLNYVRLGDKWIEGLDICASITRLDEGKIQRKASDYVAWSRRVVEDRDICISELTDDVAPSECLGKYYAGTAATKKKRQVWLKLEKSRKNPRPQKNKWEKNGRLPGHWDRAPRFPREVKKKKIDPEETPGKSDISSREEKETPHSTK
ncbi:hypothetical protein B0H13DRAFT_1896822 [Mycena leptocephala]|nr:hypothetical protein B0H13DRAFT_1896822 [Mycena leptocephala]